MACILDNKMNITDRNCRLALFRLQKVIFSDHRLIYGFNKACGHDIVELKCGRVEKNDTVVRNMLCVSKRLCDSLGSKCYGNRKQLSTAQCTFFLLMPVSAVCGHGVIWALRSSTDLTHLVHCTKST